MAEHVILFAGPMGAGKTTAISTLSDVPVISTEAANTERDVVDKDTTTVALDYGEITVGVDEKVRLYGAPGQKRFDFMWTILKERAKGLVLLVNNDAPDPLGDTIEFMADFKELVSEGRVVVGITRRDIARNPSPNDYGDAIATAHPGSLVPVFTVDPRDPTQMTTILLTLIATLDSKDAASITQGATR